MPKNKELLGFRTKKEKVKKPYEEWDVYPTHLIISDDYWTMSTTDEDKKNKK
tara:strand:+ start:493 stop:648 length:156 start_codon:yes stop_codon:yes gene_type:complete